jgi:enoyl-CoA hydratase/carnithine racemase
VAACKAAIRAASQSPGQHDMARAQAMIEACFRSDDYLEGQRAFAEKRAPAFTGR